ncbi:MAG: ABC transporter substrate-binding protein [Oscillospiraceae bacterium]|jgi:NitT/TauT family transport system substrate-binding protein|nr:ABC transporter substrate-binding protein [Oscillospiraceae bacterium]
MISRNPQRLLTNRVLAIFAAALLVFSISACAVAAPPDPARVVALKGPTGIGMAKMMADENSPFSFTLAGSPDEIVAAIASGSADIAAAPTNLAATLYNKLDGDVRLLALNTLGVLHILENGDSIQSVSDLDGRTLALSGQGAMPEYVTDYIIKQNSINVTLEYKAEHAELATLAAAGELDLVMLPEPFATSLVTQNPSFRYALDVTALFSDAAASDSPDAILSMGCVIARASFAEEHPDTIEAFINACAESIAFAKDQPEETARLTQQVGIMPSAEVVLKALPGSNLTFIYGRELRQSVEPLYKVLFDANPASIGGKMPGDDFYYNNNADAE